MKDTQKKTFVVLFFVVLAVLCICLNFSLEKKADVKQKAPPVSVEEGGREIATVESSKVLSKEETSKVIKEETTTNTQEHIYWHSTTVDITENYNTAYVVVMYTNAKNTPTEALIYSPDCSKFYSNIALNENQTGEIIFELNRPEKGTWNILLLEEINLGTYVPYVIEKSEYEERQQGLDEERIVPY